jgi:hypothetical protein
MLVCTEPMKATCFVFLNHMDCNLLTAFETDPLKTRDFF